jgi:hypothetical protein
MIGADDRGIGGEQKQARRREDDGKLDTEAADDRA